MGIAPWRLNPMFSIRANRECFAVPSFLRLYKTQGGARRAGVRCSSLLNPRSSVSICGSKAVRCWQCFAAFASGFCRPLLSAAIRLNPRPSGLASAGAEKARSLPPLRASGPPPIGGSRPARLRGRWCGIWGTRARPGGCRLLSVFPSAPGCGRRGAVRPGCHG